MNPLRPIWTFWEDWCDEDAPDLAKRLGFVSLLLSWATLAGLLARYLVTGEKPGFLVCLALIPFLVMAGCCWHVGRKAWAVGYIGMTLIVIVAMGIKEGLLI